MAQHGGSGARSDAASRRGVTTVLIYVQIIVGATMRHNDAGLAIPDFPLAFGHVFPPDWNARIAIHFAHRIGAVVVSLGILATAGHIFYHHPRRMELTRPAFALLFLVSMQVTLGAFVIWSGKNPAINTAHVVNGALVLGTSLMLTLRLPGSGSSDSCSRSGRRTPSDGIAGVRRAGARP